MDITEIKKIINVDNLNAANKYLDIFQNFYSSILLNHHYDAVNSQREADAHILLQMYFSKTLHFKHMLEGVCYQNEKLLMNRIVDPTLLFTLVRNQYECLCLFELINIIPNSEGKKTFLSLMHQIAGLKYRQRFASHATLPENLEKMKEEMQEINEDIQIIFSSSTFQKLNQKSQDQVREWIKKKEYQLYFKDDETIQKLGWKDFALKFGMKKVCVENLYSYFCLNAHPSYPSMMQFRDAFSKDSPEFINLALFASRCFLIFLSVFLVDYMRLFPTIVENFKMLDEDTQKLLTVLNDIYREEEYEFCL